MKTTHPSATKRAAALLLALSLLAAPLFSAHAADAPAASTQDTPTSENSASTSAASLPSESTPAVVPVSGEGLYRPSFAVNAQGVCLVSEETGLAVYEKNADTPMVSASLVKIMTCILVIENVTDLDAETITAQQWVFDTLYGKNASHADIRLGETLSVRELLYAMLLPSANEAALMLAGYISGGSMDNFLFMMNSRAQALGCTGTTFTDPNGLSEENRITARDATILMRSFLTHPALVEIAATPSYEMAAHEKHSAPYLITTTNRLIVPNSPYYSTFSSVSGSVQVGKTGSLGEWQNFVSYAVKDGEKYICAVLNSPASADPLGAKLEPPQSRPALYETAALYDWALTNLAVRPALDTTQPITEVRVRYSTDADAVRLVPAQDLRTVLPVDADDTMIEKKFDLPEFLPAPVKKGEIIGRVTLSLGGVEIGSSNLLAAQDVTRNSTLYALSKIGDFFRSVYLRIAIAVVLVALGAYAGVVAYLHNKKQKNNRQKNPKNPQKRD